MYRNKSLYMAFLVLWSLFCGFFPILFGGHMIITVENLIKMCPVRKVKLFSNLRDAHFGVSQQVDLWESIRDSPMNSSAQNTPV